MKKQVIMLFVLQSLRLGAWIPAYKNVVTHMQVQQPSEKNVTLDIQTSNIPAVILTPDSYKDNNIVYTLPNTQAHIFDYSAAQERMRRYGIPATITPSIQHHGIKIALPQNSDYTIKKEVDYQSKKIRLNIENCA